MSIQQVSLSFVLLMLTYVCPAQTGASMRLTESRNLNLLDLDQYGACISKKAQWVAEFGYDPLLMPFHNEVILPRQHLDFGWGKIDSLKIYYEYGGFGDRQAESGTEFRYVNVLSTFASFGYFIHDDPNSDVCLCQSDTSITIVHKNSGIIDTRYMRETRSARRVTFTTTISSSGRKTTCYGAIDLAGNPYFDPLRGYVHPLRIGGSERIDTVKLGMLPAISTIDSTYSTIAMPDGSYDLYRSTGLDVKFDTWFLPEAGTCLSYQILDLTDTDDTEPSVLQPLSLTTDGHTLMVSWTSESGSLKDQEYTIFANSGQLITTGQLDVPLPIESWPPGIYYVRAIDDNGNAHSERFSKL